MIIVLASALVFAAAAACFGGRVGRLLALRFRRMYLVWFALADQVLVISVLPAHPRLVLVTANLASYAAAGLFLWSNRRIPGVLLMGVGGALNVAAIAANGGTMPASASALRASGWRPQPGHFVNSGVVAHPRLAWVGDVFATPRWAPFHDVFSAGDVMIVLGVALLVYRTCSPVASTADPSPSAAAADESTPSATR